MIRGRVHRIGALTALLAATVSGCSSATAPPERVVLDCDFHSDTTGWRAAFSDYPEGREGDVEFVAGTRALPVPLPAGSALYHRGVNISDDLFMYFDRRVSGLRPGATYRARPARVRLELRGRLHVRRGGADLSQGRRVHHRTCRRSGRPGCRPPERRQGQADEQRRERAAPGGRSKRRARLRRRRAIRARDPAERRVDHGAGRRGGRDLALFGSESAFESAHELYFTRLVVELERRPGPGGEL
jgi:hypothetical protein